MTKVLSLLALLGLAAVAGWWYFTTLYSVPIGSLKNDPRSYAGREIVIAGTVTERFSLVVFKYFQLQDSTGSIAVISERPLPAVGTKIRVSGQIEEGFSLGDQQVMVFIEGGQ